MSDPLFTEFNEKTFNNNNYARRLRKEQLLRQINSKDGDVRRALENIYESVKQSQGVEKYNDEWIDCGLFTATCEFLCGKNIDQDKLELVYKIIKIILADSVKYFKTFFETAQEYLCNYEQSVPLLFILYCTLDKRIFEKTFTDLSGLNFLLDYYNIKLFCDQQKLSHARIRYNDENDAESGAGRVKSALAQQRGINNEMPPPGAMPTSTPKKTVVDHVKFREMPSIPSASSNQDRPTLSKRLQMTEHLTVVTGADEGNNNSDAEAGNKKFALPNLNLAKIPPATISSAKTTATPSSALSPITSGNISFMNDGPLQSGRAGSMIPSLNIPLKEETAISAKTRSSRRINVMNLSSLRLSLDTISRTHRQSVSSQASSTSSTPKEPSMTHPRSATEEIASLASKLGELYMTSDLTTLISIKREMDLRKTHANFMKERESSKPQELALSSATNGTPLLALGAGVTQKPKDTPLGAPTLMEPEKQSYVQKIIASLGFSRMNYKDVKRHLVLALIEKVTRSARARRSSRAPINLLMWEINGIREQILKLSNNKQQAALAVLPIFQEDHKRIYSILANYAEDVDARYFHLMKKQFGQAEYQMVDPTSDNALRKYDLFLWRWTSLMQSLLRKRDWENINFQLRSLSSYLYSCKSRVHASQCTAVCLDVLSRIHVLSKEGAIPERDNGYIAHYLIEIFDYIMDGPEHHPLLLEFFYMYLIETQDNFDWLKDHFRSLFHRATHHAHQQHEDESASQDFNRPFHLTKEERRVRLFKHCEILLNLIQELGEEFLDEETMDKEKKLIDPDSPSSNFKKLLEIEDVHVLNKFDFLINPIDGIALVFLTRGSFQMQYSVKKQILLFLHKIFSTPNNPFMKIESYVNTYVRYHYLNFVQLYNTPSNDPQILELCRLHLRILLAFSANKTALIVEKFHQLTVVNFLTREIELEHELTQKARKKTMQQLPSEPIKLTESSKPAVSLNLGAVASKIVPKNEQSTSTASKETPKLAIPTPTKPAPGGIGGLGGLGGLKLNMSNVPIKGGPPVPLVNDTSADEHYSSSDDEDGSRSGSDSEHSESDSARSNRSRSSRNSRSGRSYDSGSGDDSDGEENSSANTSLVGNIGGGLPQLKVPLAMKPLATNAPSLNIEKKTPRTITSDSEGIIALNTGIPNSARSQNTTSSRSHTTDNSGSDSHRSADSDQSGSHSDRSHRSEDNDSNHSEYSDDARKFPRSSDDESDEDGSHHSGSDSDSDDDGVYDHIQPPKPVSFVPSLKIAGKPEVPPLGGGANNEAKPAGLGFSLALKLPAKTEDNSSKNDRAEAFTNLAANAPSQGLTLLEQKLNQENSKLQLVLNEGGFYTYQDFENSSQASLFVRNRALLDDLMQDETKFYEHERKNRKLYQDDQIHILILSLLISLILTPSQTMEPLYTDQFPLNNKKPNIPHLLHHHINHPANQSIIPGLYESVCSLGKGASILIRLLVKKLFEPEIYKDKVKIAGGAYGDVYKCTLPEVMSYHNSGIAVKEVAVKLMSIPKGIYERCVLHDIFNEILILDRFKGDNHICRMYDFGVDDDYYYIIMKLYKTNLKEWRLRQQGSLRQNMPIYLSIYRKILEGVKFLATNNVNHFDLKCENILLHPYGDVTDDEFYNQPNGNFEVVLADFGESVVHAADGDGYTTRNRGTEFCKSPEMLKMAMLQNKLGSHYDRRRKVGANSASDVWSLGCLLYELLTGEFLFYDNDYIRFFIRVTSLNEQLIAQEKFAKLEYNPHLMDMMEYILVRDPMRRPTVKDILKRYDYWTKLLTMGSTTTTTTTNNAQIKNVPTTSINMTPSKLARKGRGSFGQNYQQSVDQQQGHRLMPLGASHTLWSDADLAFYRNRPSKILKNLYLCAGEVASSKETLFRLGITHIVNCCNVDSSNEKANCISLFRDNFFYFDLQQKPDEDSDEDEFNTSLACIEEFKDAFKFIRDAIRKRGKVMVYSQRGIHRSGIFLISYLMDTYNLSSFEAYLFVKRKRPPMRPQVLLSEFLESINNSPAIRSQQVKLTITHEELYARLYQENAPSQSPQQEKGHRSKQYRVIYYRCLCGTCVVGVVAPFYMTRFGEEEEEEDCPIYNWQSFQEEMKLLYHFPAKNVPMALAREEVVLGLDELKRNTVEHRVAVGSRFASPLTSPHTGDSDDIDPAAGTLNMSSSPAAQPAMIQIESYWKIYQCKVCGYLTHSVFDPPPPVVATGAAQALTPRQIRGEYFRIKGMKTSGGSASRGTTPQSAGGGGSSSSSGGGRGSSGSYGSNSSHSPEVFAMLNYDTLNIAVNASLKAQHDSASSLIIEDLRPFLMFKQNS